MPGKRFFQRNVGAKLACDMQIIFGADSAAAGYGDDLDLRPGLFDFYNRFYALLFRHDDVGDDHADIRIAFYCRKSLFAVARRADKVTFTQQHFADESKQATTKITSLIKDIQHATNSTVMATEESSKEIESGVELAQNINTNIESLISLISEVKISSDEIYTDSDSQTNYLNNISLSVSSLDEGLNSTLQLLDEKMETINTLNVLANSFKERIN